MGLYRTVRLAYGFEIPETDYELMETVLVDQPDAERLGRVHRLYIGDFERIFLLTEMQEIEENTAAVITPDYYQRPELAGWIAVLHDIAVRLGHAEHPLPAWLVLHDYS